MKKSQKGSWEELLYPEKNQCKNPGRNLNHLMTPNYGDFLSEADSSPRKEVLKEFQK